MQPPESSGSGQAAPPVLPTTSTLVHRGRWWLHLLLMGGYLIAVALLSSNRAPAHGPALTHSVRGLLLVCAYQVGVFGILFGLAWLASRASREQLLLRWRPGLWVVPLGIGYSVALRLWLAVVWIGICLVLLAAHVLSLGELQNFIRANRPQVDVLVDVSALRHNPAYLWLTLTLVSFVVAGLREELWRSSFLAGLRELWPKYFGSRGGEFGAVAVAAVLFGAGHVAQGVLAVGLAGVLGLGLGAIMVLHRSIWPAVIAHGLFDATTFGLLPWAMEKIHQLQ